MNNNNNINFQKLDTNYIEYKKQLLNVIEKECNSTQRYLDSFKDVYTGWKPGIYSNLDYMLKYGNNLQTQTDLMNRSHKQRNQNNQNDQNKHSDLSNKIIENDLNNPSNLSNLYKQYNHSNQSNLSNHKNGSNKRTILNKSNISKKISKNTDTNQININESINSYSNASDNITNSTSDIHLNKGLFLCKNEKETCKLKYDEIKNCDKNFNENDYNCMDVTQKSNTYKLCQSNVTNKICTINKRSL